MNTTTLQKTKHKILDDAHSNNIIISDMNLGNKFKHFENEKLRESKTLLHETKIRPKYYKKYYRGEIIKVHFGINAGSEFSGDHFAIVISEKDTIRNPLLHVIPISSKKHFNCVNLGNILYNKQEINKLKLLYKNETDKKEKQQVKECLNRYNKCRKIISYALVEHMRTISKLLIIKPINKYDYIKKIKISDKQLNEVIKKIKEEYKI